MHGARVKKAWKPQKVGRVGGSEGHRGMVQEQRKGGQVGMAPGLSRLKVRWCLPGIAIEFILRPVVH